MTRTSLIPALVLALSAAACGPMETGDAALLADPSAGAPVFSSSGGGDASLALQLPAAPVVAGASLTGTVSGSGGVAVYLGFNQAVFAGPRYVRIPAGKSSASFTLYANPWIAAATAATISARTQSPNPAVFVSQPVTVVPASTPPAGPAPQVASAVLAAGTLVTGSSTTFTVTLTAPAPSDGAAVLLSISNDFFSLDADLPPVVVVPAGQATVSVLVHAHLSSAVATTVTEYVVANLFGGPFKGQALVVNAR